MYFQKRVETPPEKTDSPTGPRNLSIRHVDAIPDIYGYQSSCVKGVQVKGGKLHSLMNLIDWDEHMARRKLFDQGLAPKRKLFISSMRSVTD